MNRMKWIKAAAALLLLIMMSVPAFARKDNEAWVGKMKDPPRRDWAFETRFVHNVGNLQMNVTNWGCFGSYPGGTWTISENPSAQWPANSGVEYLYIAGLWVGAKKGGVPVVSTAAYEIEFQPEPLNPINTIYRSFEGAMGGARYPSPPDDDKDGLFDEDWLNGYDDDGDGQIDEDFAAIGKQMYSCEFNDYQTYASQRYPDHTPLYLDVRQESYQWEEPKFYNFVGVEYKIKNMGVEAIEDIYIGFFADGDAGPRTREQYWQDDLTGLIDTVVCAQKGERQVPIRVSIAYFRDDDGDEGMTLGVLGILFLGHDTDPLGEDAPKKVAITSYQNFSGDQPYENGGDPDNDIQRYDLLSKTTFDKVQQVPRDYRMLMATGPFRELAPDSMLILQVAFVCGLGLEGMLKNAASAALTYQGNWFDVDTNPLTGVDGRETPVPGPVSGIIADSCASELAPVSAARGEIVWINADCRSELELWNDQNCSKGDATFADYQTGVGGKEFNVHWLVGSAPPPPAMRLIPGDNKVTILWDNFSEVTPDISTLQKDFEGYRIWRADGWDRPLGTTVLTGPSRDLWQLIEERDYADNDVPPNREFRMPDSLGGWQYTALKGLRQSDIDAYNSYLAYFEENVLIYPNPADEIPCPAGLAALECDTLEALARYKLGFEGGLQYYRFVDTSVHNGMHYFYSVTAYDHTIVNNMPKAVGYYGDPSSNFQYVTPLSDAQPVEAFEEKEIYVVPNPATVETMEPWRLEANQDDPTGIKVEFRNLPRCRSTVRIYTVAGDLVEVLYHDGSEGNGSLPWDLVSRNGQDVTSGVYLYSVEPDDGRYSRTIGKFVVIR